MNGDENLLMHIQKRTEKQYIIQKCKIELATN